MMDFDDAATEFFREIVEPTVAEFVRQPDNRRLGCLACLCLASMADHYFYARPNSVDGYKDANAFRNSIGTNWAVKQVVGVANATKHTRRLPGRVGYEDISAQPIDCGNLQCGWPIDGTYVMIDVGGHLWLLVELVEATVNFWRDRLDIGAQ